MLTFIAVVISSPKAWPLAFFVTITFFCLLGGLKDLLSAQKELPFVEIEQESIRLRRYEDGAVISIPTEKIEVVFISHSYIELSLKGDNETKVVYFEGEDSESLSIVFKDICPDAIIKTSNVAHDER